MRFSVLAFLCLAAIIAYVQRAAMSVPEHDIEHDLGLGVRQMGIVMSAWYWGYAVMQLPSGWLADRWGSRRALAAFAVAWSLLTGLTGLAQDYSSLIVPWFAMGMAQAGIFPCSTKAMGAWFSDTQRARAVGALACSMALGTAIAPLLASGLLAILSHRPDQLVETELATVTEGSLLLAGLYPWQVVLLLYAVPGVLWTIGFLAVVPESPPHAPVSRLDARFDWGVLLTSVPMALLCGQQFLRAAAMAFFITFFPKFMQESRGVTQLESGLFTAWAAAGAMFGGLSGGTVSDLLLKRTGNRRLSRQGVAVAGMTVCALLIFAAYFVADTWLAVLLISLGTLAGTFGGISGYTVAIEFGGSRVGAVFSLMNMCGNIGAALFPLAVGQIVEYTGDWNFVLFLFAGCFAAAGVCWALMNPQGTLFKESP